VKRGAFWWGVLGFASVAAAGGGGPLAASVRAAATTDEPSGTTTLTTLGCWSCDDVEEAVDDALLTRPCDLSDSAVLLKCGSLSGIIEKSKKGNRPLYDEERGREKGTWRALSASALVPQVLVGVVLDMSLSLVGSFVMRRSVASDADEALDLKNEFAMLDRGVVGVAGSSAPLCPELLCLDLEGCPGCCIKV